jgi:hypothetical protein
VVARHPRWLPRVVDEIRRLAAAAEVRMTHKASLELARLGLGLDPEDARQALCGLTAADFAARTVSRLTGEWMYAFVFAVAGIPVYTKLILRRECVIVSFHEDIRDEGDHESDEN